MFYIGASVAVAGALTAGFLLSSLSTAAYLLVGAFSAVAPWCGLRWYRPVAASTWRHIGVGLALVFVGDLYFVFVSPWLFSRPDPVVSVADIAYLGGYVAVGAGLVRLSRRRGVPYGTDLLLDSAAGTVALAVILGPLVVLPALEAGASWLETVVNVAYPLADVALLAAVVRMAVTSAQRTCAGALLVAGLGGWLVGDVAYLMSVGAGSYAFGANLLDLVWMFAAAAFGLAALHPSMVHVSPASLSLPADRHGRMAVSALALWAVPAALVVAPDAAAEAGIAYWVVVVAALATLVTWRATRMLFAQQRVEGELAQAVRYFGALAANTSDALLAVDGRGRAIDASPALQSLLQREHLVLGGADIWSHIHPDDIDQAKANFAEALSRPGDTIEAEVRIIDDTGSARWLATRTVNLLDDPDVGCVVINIDDITGRRAAEMELARQATSDALTGLGNRMALQHRLRQLPDSDPDDSGRPVLILADIDRFKKLNDRLGFEKGDRVLSEVAERLRRTTGPSGLVARIGADEFAVLLPHGPADAVGAFAVASRLLAVLSNPVIVDGNELVLSVSIGVAAGPWTGDDDRALRHAELALHEAKRQGGGQCLVLDEPMREAADERSRLNEDLCHALERAQLELHFQPIRDLRTGDTTGFEALLRWQHPELGLVPPDRFIPAAEETGLIVPIGAWVIDSACAMLAACRQQYEHLHMSVNVSGRQLADGAFVDAVRRALCRHRLPGSALTIEITETTLVDDPETATMRLHAVKGLGVTVAIDDFGTGYSSLSYLRQFPVDVLKVDRSFVGLVVDAGPVPPILRGLLDLASALELTTVAEGIETERQLEVLQSEGCHFGQGHLFSPPVPASAATSLLGRAPDIHERDAAFDPATPEERHCEQLAPSAADSGPQPSAPACQRETSTKRS